MTTFSIESSIFAKLKTTVGINSIALQRLIDAANQNPELNLMLTKAESFNDVIIRIAENNELVNLGAGAVFDYFTQGQINDNRMAIIIDPSWVIGPSATLNTTSLATRASVLNVFGHEFDHYMRVETFREIDKLQDLSYRPELTAEQRFELYATQRMQAEVQGVSVQATQAEDIRYMAVNAWIKINSRNGTPQIVITQVRNEARNDLHWRVAA